MKVEFLDNDIAFVSAYRYDYGQTLEISGLELEDGFEVHFQNGTENPEIRRGTVDANGVCIVAIPDKTLSLGYDSVKTLAYDATAWVYVKTPDSGTTIKTIVINIIPREKPADIPSVDDYQEIKSYADYVRENAEMVSQAQAVADKLKADAEAGLFNGKDGVNGIDGKDGVNGKDGKDGRDGVDGKNGLDGAKGDKGEKGEQGLQGIQGLKGDKGDKGDQGLQGIQGLKGADGKNGVNGADGKSAYIILNRSRQEHSL